MSKSLLVIDDEASVRQSIAYYFEDLGFEVFQADDGLPGLILFDRKRPDVVVVDLYMSAVGGLEVVSEIKKKAPDTPVIIVSGMGVLGDAIKAVRFGAWDYVLKPISDMGALEVTIDRALEHVRLVQQNHLYQQQLETKVQRQRQKIETTMTSLTDSEQRYRTLIDQAGDAVFVCDLEGRIRDTNLQAERALGYTRTELLDMSIMDMDAVFTDLPSVQAIWNTMEVGQPMTFETRHKRKDGTEFPVELRAGTFELAGERFILGLARDITWRREAEAALRESEETHRLAMAATSDGLWDWQMESGHVYYSPAWATILGESSMEPSYHAWESRLHPGDREAILASLSEHLEGKTSSWQTEHRLRTHDGHWKWVLGQGMVVSRDAEGQPLRMVGTMTDISVRMQYAHAIDTIIRGASAQFGEALFEKMTEQLAEALRADYVLVGRMADPGHAQVQTVALVAHGQLVDNIVYDLAGTPCENVVGKEVCSYTERVAELFPDDAMLRDIGAQGYVGVPLFDSNGGALGIVAALFARSLEDTSYAETVLQLFSGRIGAEIERNRVGEALAESEDKYRTLIENSPDVIMRFDREGRHLFVSQSVDRILDIPVADFLGKTHSEMGFPEAQCIFWERHIRETIDTQKPFETEFEFLSAKGPTTFNWRLVPEIGADGQCHSVLSLARDISKQRKAESDYQLIFNQMIDGFALHDIILDDSGHPVDYRFVDVNPAFEALTGLKAETIRGKSVLEVLPDTEARWITIYGEVALTGKAIRFEEYAQALDKHYEVVAFSPEAHKFACIFVDITERKRVAEELEESEEKFSKVFLENPNVMMLADARERTVLEVNQAFLEKTGHTVEDVVNVPGQLGISIIESDVREAVLRALLEDDRLSDFEITVKTASGKALALLAFAEPVDIQGRHLHIITLIDITKRKHAEIQLQENQVRLRSLGTELTLVEERERRRIATSLHDGACQSLAMSNLKLQALQASLEPEKRGETKEVCRSIEQVVQELRDLTFDLSPPTLYMFGLEAAIDELLDQELRVKQGIQYTFGTAEGYLPMANDLRVLLYQSIRELVFNIIKHAQADLVDVTLTQEGSDICVTLHDNGKGFDVDQVKSSMSSTGGFGLFNVAERLRSIGGSLQIESSHGKGTRIVLLSPFVQVSTVD